MRWGRVPFLPQGPAGSAGTTRCCNSHSLGLMSPHILLPWPEASLHFGEFLPKPPPQHLACLASSFLLMQEFLGLSHGPLAPLTASPTPSPVLQAQLSSQTTSPHPQPTPPPGSPQPFTRGRHSLCTTHIPVMLPALVTGPTTYPRTQKYQLLISPQGPSDITMTWCTHRCAHVEAGVCA